MKKVLVLWAYWNVWQVVSIDLINSWFFVWIWWRNEKKIDSFISKIKSNNVEKVLFDISDEKSLLNVFSNYDLIINCLEYTFNQTILDSCIKSAKNYVDLWDDYEWIKISRSKDWLAKENWIFACIWAWSAPGIVNILTKYAIRDIEEINTITISFSDEVKNAPEKMLPFNFQTVVEEIIGDALLFENWKYSFVKWNSKKIDADFCNTNSLNQCFLPGSLVTNHDEQFSLPDYLSNKWIKNFYFVMKHSDNVVKLVESLDEFWFLSKEKINVKWVEISPFDFCNTIMSNFAPQNFKVEDKESLFIKIDNIVVEIVNYSVDWIPAWVMNTWIWCSLIAQDILNNSYTPGVNHPEDFVDEEWFISELKKRNFEIYIDWKRI